MWLAPTNRQDAAHSDYARCQIPLTATHAIQVILMTSLDIRAALERHWAASDASDFETEHEIYCDDAILDYPQSGERIRGRRQIQFSRAAQPNKSGSTLNASWAQMIFGSQNLCLHMMTSRRTWSALWNFMADKWPMKLNTSVMRSSRGHHAHNG